MFLKRIPFVENYYLPIRIVGFVVMCFGIFFEGALHNNREWIARVKEMEAKVAAAEVESKKENVKIVQKVVVKQQIVKERGEEIIKYVDREITKYDNTCVIPKEFVRAVNDAAKEIK
jgi:lipopolysaccharide export system protein LptA